MAAKEKTKAVSYLRTSSATSVGADKDSDKRQREAIQKFAKTSGHEIVEEFYDKAVSGADAVDARAGFSSMMEWIAANGIQTIIVETANRFARDLMVQEVGFDMLRKAGITLIAADKPDAFLDDGPTAVLVRQILGAVAQFDKTMTVAKLRGARERKAKATGQKCGGRKRHEEIHPEVVATARKLRRYRINGRQRSLREISAELVKLGFVNANGRPFAAASIRAMTDAR
jgi:DNA invertase Pin-like site-specific DNA recombinase